MGRAPVTVARAAEAAVAIMEEHGGAPGDPSGYLAALGFDDDGEVGEILGNVSGGILDGYGIVGRAIRESASHSDALAAVSIACFAVGVMSERLR